MEKNTQSESQEITSKGEDIAALPDTDLIVSDIVETDEPETNIVDSEFAEENFVVGEADTIVTPEVLNADNQQNLICGNCQTPLDGAFCSVCGQSLRTPIRKLHFIMKDLLEDELGFDSRAAKTSWRLFFRPGFLSNEYIAGHRVKFVPPVRLYLITSIIFFLTLQLVNQFQEPWIDTVDLDSSQIQTGSEDNEKLAQLLEDETLHPEAKKVLKELQNKKIITDLIDSKKNVKELEETQSRIETSIKGPDKKNNSKKESQVDPIISFDTSSSIPSADKLDASESTDINLNLNNKVGNFFEKQPLNLNFLTPENNQKLTGHIIKSSGRLTEMLKEDPMKIMDMVIEKIPGLMFLLLPIFALILKFSYLFKRRLYMEHLIVALHGHSFLFLSLWLILIFTTIEKSFVGTWPEAETSFGVLTTVILIWIPINLFVTQKRVYQQGYFFTLLKFSIISWSYLILLLSIGILAFLISVLLL